jgi:hypothetical protein
MPWCRNGQQTFASIPKRLASGYAYAPLPKPHRHAKGYAYDAPGTMVHRYSLVRPGGVPRYHHVKHKTTGPSVVLKVKY